MPMPRDGARLEWVEVKEFGGLWTAGEQSLMPATKAQVMSGCHPQVGGGLRAFFKVTDTVPGNGLVANQLAVGFNVTIKGMGPIANMTEWEARYGPGALPTETRPVFTVVTVDSTGGLADNWRISSWDDAAGDTAWSQFPGDFAGLDYYGASPRPSPPSFATSLIDPMPAFPGSLGTAFSVDFVALAIQEQPDPAPSGSGIYQLRRTDGVLSTERVTTGEFGNASGASALTVHQARLVVGHHEDIRFSAPGTLDFGADGAGALSLNPGGWFVYSEMAVNEGALVAWMISVPPGDLIVATRDGSIYNVQGDLGDPTVRELGRWGSMIPHEPVLTPNGLFFILPNQGVHVLGLDGSVEPVSSDLDPALWNYVTPKISLGQMAGDERFLFAPNLHSTPDHSNGALVYDMQTRAWFTSAHPDDVSIPNPRLMKADRNPQDSGIWIFTSEVLDGTTAPVAWHYRTGIFIDAETSSQPRASTYEYRTAPLRDPSGRRVIVREVRIPTYAFNADTSTLAVTVNGTTVTRTLPAGQSTQVFLFREEDNLLDITVKAKSNDTDVEAPMIEALRFGWRPGRLEHARNVHTP